MGKNNNRKRVPKAYMTAWGFKPLDPQECPIPFTAFVAPFKNKCKRCKKHDTDCIVRRFVVVNDEGTFEREECWECAEDGEWCSESKKIVDRDIIADHERLKDSRASFRDYNTQARKDNERRARKELKRKAKENEEKAKNADTAEDAPRKKVKIAGGEARAPDARPPSSVSPEAQVEYLTATVKTLTTTVKELAAMVQSLQEKIDDSNAHLESRLEVMSENQDIKDGEDTTHFLQITSLNREILTELKALKKKDSPRSPALDLKGIEKIFSAHLTTAFAKLRPPVVRTNNASAPKASPPLFMGHYFVEPIGKSRTSFKFNFLGDSEPTEAAPEASKGSVEPAPETKKKSTGHRLRRSEAGFFLSSKSQSPESEGSVYGKEASESDDSDSDKESSDKGSTDSSDSNSKSSASSNASDSSEDELDELMDEDAPGPVKSIDKVAAPPEAPVTPPKAVVLPLFKIPAPPLAASSIPRSFYGNLPPLAAKIPATPEPAAQSSTTQSSPEEEAINNLPVKRTPKTVTQQLPAQDEEEEMNANEPATRGSSLKVFL